MTLERTTSRSQAARKRKSGIGHYPSQDESGSGVKTNWTMAGLSTPPSQDPSNAIESNSFAATRHARKRNAPVELARTFKLEVQL